MTRGSIRSGTLFKHRQFFIKIFFKKVPSYRESYHHQVLIICAPLTPSFLHTLTSCHLSSAHPFPPRNRDLPAESSVLPGRKGWPQTRALCTALGDLGWETSSGGPHGTLTKAAGGRRLAGNAPRDWGTTWQSPDIFLPWMEPKEVTRQDGRDRELQPVSHQPRFSLPQPCRGPHSPFLSTCTRRHS